MSPIDFSSFINSNSTRQAVDTAKYATGQDDNNSKKADDCKDTSAIKFISQSQKTDDNSQLA